MNLVYISFEIEVATNLDRMDLEFPRHSNPMWLLYLFEVLWDFLILRTLFTAWKVCMCTILYMYSCETYACTCVYKCIHAFAHLPIQIHKDFASQCDCTHILTCCSHLSCRLKIFALAVAILATLLAHTCLLPSCRHTPSENICSCCIIGRQSSCILLALSLRSGATVNSLETSAVTM